MRIRNICVNGKHGVGSERNSPTENGKMMSNISRLLERGCVNVEL
jgi:hypothetical protein